VAESARLAKAENLSGLFSRRECGEGISRPVSAGREPKRINDAVPATMKDRPPELPSWS
jgi:hypothetical protein